jgi:hypothetical protein
MLTCAREVRVKPMLSKTEINVGYQYSVKCKAEAANTYYKLLTVYIYLYNNIVALLEGLGTKLARLARN